MISESASRTLDENAKRARESRITSIGDKGGPDVRQKNESPAFRNYSHIKTPGKELEMNILHRKHDI